MTRATGGSARRVDWIALNLLPGLGPLAKHRAVQVLGDPAKVAYHLPPREFPSRARRGPADLERIRTARAGLRRQAERELRRSERLGLQLLVPGDADYPAVFELLPDPPPVLYLKGRLEPARVRVAVIGSRRPTAYGRRVASGLASSLALEGVEVVSGGARGIDTAAHRGALDAGGSTLAVLGSGLLQPYPRENLKLFEQIARAGAVVSEFGLDVTPRPEHFPRRNRLISALSAAVVVVEAARRSGTLSTACHALDQGREVLAVPGPITSEASEGCHRLIQQGAKLVRGVDDVLEELSPMYRAVLGPRSALSGRVDGQDRADGGPGPPADLSPDERAVLSLLDEVEPSHIDDLARRAPFGVARLQAALFGLLVAGSVEELTGRYYVSRPRKEPR